MVKTVIAAMAIIPSPSKVMLCNALNGGQIKWDFLIGLKGNKMNGLAENDIAEDADDIHIRSLFNTVRVVK